MSDIDHTAAALEGLELITASDNPMAEMASASEATAHALLAIETRLGEIAGHLHTANLLGAFMARVWRSDDEFSQSLTAVRTLLGLPEWPREESENR